MAGLADFRQQHPEYNDMSDQDLADALHRKFYSDMPQDQFYAKMGINQPSLGDYATDAARSLPGGVVKGVTGLVGAPGDIHNAVVGGIRYAGNLLQKGAGDAVATAVSPSVPFAGSYSSGELNDAIDHNIGFYKPKTGAGEFTENAASFLPALFGGEASIPARLATRVVAPAAGATVAGENSNSPIARAVGAIGAGLLAHSTSGLVGAVRNARLPDDVAGANHVLNVLGRDSATPESILAAGDANGATGRGMMGAEASGQNGIRALKVLGRQPGATAGPLSAALLDRNAGTGERMLDDYTAASGIDPRLARGSIDTAVEAGQNAAAPLFKKALVGNPVWNDALAELTNRPVIKTAIGQAIANMKNNPRLGNPTMIGLEVGPDGELVQNSVPTDTAWDLIRKATRAQVERNPVTQRVLPDSVSPGNHNVGIATGDLTTALRDAIPHYGDALDTSSDYLRLQNAFDQGGASILNRNQPTAAFADILEGKPQVELDAVKGGVGNKLFNAQQNNGLRPNIIQVPAVQGKLQALLGPEKADQLTGALLKELELRSNANTMLPRNGSDTFANAAEASAQSDMPDIIRHGTDLARGAIAIKSGNPLGALDRIAAIASRANAARQTFGLTPGARDAAGQILMQPPADLAEFLRTTKPTNAGAATLGDIVRNLAVIGQLSHH